MAIISDITSQRARLVKAVYKGKLGKRIVKDVLVPILDQLEKDIPKIMQDAAEWARMRIVEYLRSTTPSGRTYKIYHYDPSQPRGNRTTLIEEYTASAPGEPPAQLTGTLIEAIDYRIFSDGAFQVGLLKDVGEFSDSLSEFESVFYRAGKIFVNPDLESSTQTPVGTYGKFLEQGTQHMAPRPWFSSAMNEIRSGLRDRIRKNVKISLNKATKLTTIRSAIVFKVYFK